MGTLGEGAKVKLMRQNIVWDAVPPLTTKNTVEAVVVKNFETALILYAQWPLLLHSYQWFS